MSVATGKIRYQDLVEDVERSLEYIAGNVGSDYKANVPPQLKYPYTYTPTIGVENGAVPVLDWANRAELAVVSKQTFHNDYTTFLTSQHLDIASNINTPVTTSLLIKYITSMLCYINARFVRVYSPLHKSANIFFIPSLSPTINMDAQVDINITDIDLTTIHTIVDALALVAKRPTRSFPSLIGYSYHYSET